MINFVEVGKILNSKAKCKRKPFKILLFFFQNRIFMYGFVSINLLYFFQSLNLILILLIR